MFRLLKEVRKTAQSNNGNGRNGSTGQNGKQNHDLEVETQYEHLKGDTWGKTTGNESSLTDSQAIRDELDEDKDSSGDDRN